MSATCFRPNGVTGETRATAGTAGSDVLNAYRPSGVRTSLVRPFLPLDERRSGQRSRTQRSSNLLCLSELWSKAAATGSRQIDPRGVAARRMARRRAPMALHLHV